MSDNHAEDLLVEDCQYFAPKNVQKNPNTQLQVRKKGRGRKFPKQDNEAMEINNEVDWNRFNLFQQQWTKTKAFLDDVTAEFFEVYVTKLYNFVSKYTQNEENTYVNNKFDNIPTAIISLSLYI